MSPRMSSMTVIYWYTILIILGMLSSIPCFFLNTDQNKKKHLIIFLILVLITIVELWGRHKALLGQNNSLIYNVGYILMGLSLKLYFFFYVFKEKKEKRFVLTLLTAYLSWCIINFLFFQPHRIFHHYSFAFGSLIIIGFCFYFFYGIFFKNWYLDRNLLAVSEFWVISFLMFFYSASFLHFISFKFYIEKMNIDLFRQLSFLVKILGNMMYVVMGLAFYAPLLFKEREK